MEMVKVTSVTGVVKAYDVEKGVKGWCFYVPFEVHTPCWSGHEVKMRIAEVKNPGFDEGRMLLWFSHPDGDAPFVNSLELCPLPSTLTSTIIMNGTGLILSSLDHTDYGVLASMPSMTRYPSDPLDRLWLSYIAEAGYMNTTEATIDTDQIYKPPAQIFQTAYVGKSYITLNYTTLDPKVKYLAEFYFVEIDPAVNSSGLRVFNIYANGDLMSTAAAIDVYARVGANAAFGYPVAVSPNADGVVTFNFSSMTTSTYPPYLAAAEFFSSKMPAPLTSSSVGQ
ncbi:hypothetical protein L7F22_012058 [Adiantum nelumboides]|nr:hypothetical protein [Adiantum nelumboides]